MKKGRLAGYFFIFILSFFFVFGSMPVEAKTYKLRIQCVYPETSHGPQMLKKFAERVKKYTKDKVKIEIFWPNQLVKIREAYDATSKGMIEGLYSCAIYYGGIVPELKTEWVPFNWRNPEEAVDIILERGYMDMLRKVNKKHNVYYLNQIMTGTMGAMTKFPVKGLADFKGKKLRATGMDGKVSKIIGSAAVAIPGPEMYTALKRGTVDGTIYPFYTIKTYKLYEVISYIILPGFHTPSTTGIFINLDFWKSLSPDLQFALERAGQETMLLSAMASERWDREAIENAEKHGVKVITLPEADVAKLRTMLLPLWDEVGKATPVTKEIIQLLKDGM